MLVLVHAARKTDATFISYFCKNKNDVQNNKNKRKKHTQNINVFFSSLQF